VPACFMYLVESKGSYVAVTSITPQGENCHCHLL
jgi:hypothetical protein